MPRSAPTPPQTRASPRQTCIPPRPQCAARATAAPRTAHGARGSHSGRSAHELVDDRLSLPVPAAAAAAAAPATDEIFSRLAPGQWSNDSPHSAHLSAHGACAATEPSRFGIGTRRLWAFTLGGAPQRCMPHSLGCARKRIEYTLVPPSSVPPSSARCCTIFAARKPCRRCWASRGGHLLVDCRKGWR